MGFGQNALSNQHVEKGGNNQTTSHSSPFGGLAKRNPPNDFQLGGLRLRLTHPTGLYCCSAFAIRLSRSSIAANWFFRASI
jgi:hypothetical protein